MAWWAEYTLASPQDSGVSLHIVQSAKQPKAGGTVIYVYGPYATKAAAEKANGGGPPPGKPASATGGITSLGGGSGSLLSSSNPLAALFQANIWIRVGQVALGLLLIAIGTAQLTHAVPIATTIAKAVK